jgi:hypothetical protein
MAMWVTAVVAAGPSVTLAPAVWRRHEAHGQVSPGLSGMRV